MTAFQFANSSQPVPDAIDIPISFSIKAAPSTDVWDKPPATHSFNAPILHRVLPLKTFKRARVSVAAEWKNLYDQGGLILVIYQKDGDNEQQQTRKWIKTGIEFTAGKPHISVVATDRWSDWSLTPVPSGGNTATIEIVREEEQENTLWVYLVDGSSRFPLREVTWAFEEEKTAECWIGAYAAKPYSSPDTDDLAVDFQHLIVETVVD
ncbi:hypothetical protein UA08_05114 [Talaromyces atroroseus]|uniref:Beta-xylosidase C-terminal Concanavalin A-like domain-containing protein n=1 Tax=Talaromyces atroroseus TaxID=1441469 RepID=A0A225AYG6_TALAT|nr:hypothetical protein UA08_05114 [Talaromyces atroroseus]OKL59515.1 hypothetical protein UA08_05114 [Talaromyces atroroseus]